MRLCYKQMLNKIYHKKKTTQQKKSNKNLMCTKSLLKKKSNKKVMCTKSLLKPKKKCMTSKPLLNPSGPLPEQPTPCPKPLLPTPLNTPLLPTLWWVFYLLNSFKNDGKMMMRKTPGRNKTLILCRAPLTA